MKKIGLAVLGLVVFVSLPWILMVLGFGFGVFVQIQLVRKFPDVLELIREHSQAANPDAG